MAIDWVEVEGPFFDTWPPPSQAPVQRFAAHAARKDPPPGVARPHRELPKRPDNGHNGRNSHGPFEFAAVGAAGSGRAGREVAEDVLASGFPPASSG